MADLPEGTRENPDSQSCGTPPISNDSPGLPATNALR